MDRYVTSIEGIPGETYRVDCTDAVQQLVAVNYTLRGIPATHMVITCEAQAVKYAFNVDPTQIADPQTLGHTLAVGGVITLGNNAQMAGLRFINEAAMTFGVLQITPFYEIGT